MVSGRPVFPKPKATRVLSAAMLMRRIATARRWLGWTLSYDRFLSDMNLDPAPDYLKLFEKTGIALIHIPKTGGTSLSFALYGRAIWHRRWDQIRSADPAGFERWLKVAVIRDPVDRFVSAFAYLKSGGSNEFDRFISKRFLACGLDEFVERLAASAPLHPVMDYWHFRPQAAFVLADDGTQMVDRLIPFEQLAEGARDLGIAELPRLNTTHQRRETPSQASRAGIEALYARDVVLYRQVMGGVRYAGGSPPPATR